MKPIAWCGSSRADLTAFPSEARRMAGFELWQVQNGDEPSDSKPMPDVGIGVAEIRIRLARAFRVVYVAKFPEAVYVLHAFEKKARKTPKPDIDLARKRYREMMSERRSWEK